MIVLASILTPLERPLQAILEWLHGSIGITWGWSIVVLTVLVRIVLLPLTVKQIHSMQRLQQYAPQLKALQQKYKGDKQRLNEEVMKFYKENKVNPAASCLPVVLQFPVFIALYYTLRNFEKNVLPSYPNSDLSFIHIVPNIADKISEHWSGWLLLGFYVASQILSTLLMSSTMDKTQRTLLLVLPVGFAFILPRFPVGLLIYWVTTNLWTIGQGLVTRRAFPRAPVALPRKTSRTRPGGGPPESEPEPPEQARPAQTAKPAAKPEAKKAAAQAQSDGSAQPRPVRRRKKRGPHARR